MNAPLFDTHLMVKRLMAAGFSDNQAETVTDVVREARQFDLENLSTKTDLADLKSELKAEIAALRGETQLGFAKAAASLSESRADTLRWTVGLMIAQTGLIVALIKILQGP